MGAHAIGKLAFCSAAFKTRSSKLNQRGERSASEVNNKANQEQMMALQEKQ